MIAWLKSAFWLALTSPFRPVRSWATSTLFGSPSKLASRPSNVSGVRPHPPKNGLQPEPPPTVTAAPFFALFGIVNWKLTFWFAEPVRRLQDRPELERVTREGAAAI